MPNTMMLVESSKLRKIANYVGEAQDIIQKHSSLVGKLQSVAPELVDSLVRQGQLSTHRKESKLKSIVDNPEELCEAITKLASLESAPSMGAGVDKSASVPPQETSDAIFERGLGLR